VARTVVCPGCGKSLRLRDDLAGRKVKCPECSKEISVPAESGSSKTATDEIGPPGRKKGDSQANVARSPRQDSLEEASEESDSGSDRPRRRKKTRAGNFTPLFWAVGGGIGLITVVGLAVLLIIGIKWISEHEENPTKAGIISASHLPPPDTSRVPPPPEIPVPPPLPNPFLDDRRSISAWQDWNREVVAQKAGPVTFQMSSQGPVAITIVTAQAFKQWRADKKTPIKKEDVLFTQESKEVSIKGTVKLPAGPVYFMMLNRAAKPVEIRLQCAAN
jgi:hypothetical protein